ncbi:head-tail connector protein [Defluviimonas sp. SAOS-178_SWC]|uniref:head-tail connector protein n=1 Tax=Defluviimonas sp. SAOS-178_SWC TaxID=3121287 RepID=UPI003221F4AA
MMLSEVTPVPQAALPVAEFKDHLRLGTGFADDGSQNSLAESYLRAALAAIEGRIGKALIARDFLLELNGWRWPDSQAFPLAPVMSIASVTVKDRDGVADLIDPTRYRLVRDAHRPKVAATGALLPGIPVGGTVEVVFTAGFGPAWTDVPVDLGQAVFLLAAQYHETRHETETGQAMPFGVTALIERWRTVRVLGGGAA